MAEDNEVNQFAAIRMLQKRGYEVEVADNGREAVQMAGRGRYAAIFMDCQMPELDGYEATGAIRPTKASARHTPIIAMTANTMSGDRERCLAAGMDDYLAKPLRLESLAAVCERWLPAEVPVPAPVAAPAAPPASLFECGVLAEFASPVQIAGPLSLFVTQLHDGMVELREALGAGRSRRRRLTSPTVSRAARQPSAPAPWLTSWTPSPATRGPAARLQRRCWLAHRPPRQPRSPPSALISGPPIRRR